MYPNHRGQYNRPVRYEQKNVYPMHQYNPSPQRTPSPDRRGGPAPMKDNRVYAPDPDEGEKKSDEPVNNYIVMVFIVELILLGGVVTLAYFLRLISVIYNLR